MCMFIPEGIKAETPVIPLFERSRRKSAREGSDGRVDVPDHSIFSSRPVLLLPDCESNRILGNPCHPKQGLPNNLLKNLLSGSFYGFIETPFFYFGMIAREQNFWYFPTLIFDWFCIMRILN
jgi:hypothetical protein